MQSHAKSCKVMQSHASHFCKHGTTCRVLQGAAGCCRVLQGAAGCESLANAAVAVVSAPVAPVDNELTYLTWMFLLNPILFRNPMYLSYTSLRFVVGHGDDHGQSVDHPLAPCLHGARLRFKG